MNAPLVRASRVGKRYRFGSGHVGALVDVDLEVTQGEAVAITGPSGSGKSTLLNLIGRAGRLADAATSG